MISVIVPVYNVERYLRECVDSIINQTYRDLEIILIDDGSSDKCGSICDEYAKKDERVRVIHTDNSGLSIARNTGIEAAQGDYIGFVDSDDWIDSRMYEILIDRMNESGADIVVGQYWYESDFTKRRIGVNQEVILPPEQAVRWIVLGQLNDLAWNKLYKASCWKNVRYPENCVYEDITTTYKVFLNANRIATSSECVYHYRDRKDGITATVSMTNMRDYWRAFYLRYQDIKSNPYFKEDRQVIKKSLYLVAVATSQNWRWIHSIAKADRDYDHLREVSQFNRKTFPRFGEKNWAVHLKILIFLARYVNGVSFLTAYVLNQGYRLINRRKRRITIQHAAP